MFKTLQIPFCFYPDAAGGTEVYVEALAQDLKKLGVESVVCAPAEKESTYSHKGLKVRRFALPSAVSNLRELYGEGNFEAAHAFARILDEEKPDLVHLHAFTRAVSLLLVQETKKRNIPVLFTYHTPTVSCQRGTLLRWGKEICDGVLRLHTCSRCTLHGFGMTQAAAYLIGSLPFQAGRFLGNLGLSGGGWTALRMTELIKIRHRTFQNFMAEVDHIIATADWVKDLLIRNKIPQDKITISRQGLCVPVPEHSTNNQQPTANLKVAFMGRLSPEKGLHILIQAFRSNPSIEATLDIYGIVQGEGGHEYENKLRSLAGDDARIRFLPAVSADKVGETLRNCNILAVPSQWLETGPLVILEAFAAGIPVIGSNLGGISELVKHEVNGLLIEHNSIKGWSKGLRRFSEDSGLRDRLHSAVCSPKKMETVTEEMISLYREVMNKKIHAYS